MKSRNPILALVVIGLFTATCGRKKSDQAQYLAFAGKVMQDALPPMIKTLQAQVDKNGHAASVGFCSQFAGEHGKAKNAEWAAKAIQELGVKSYRFRRVSDRNRNPKNAANAKQAEVLANWLKDGAKPTLYKEGNRIITMHPIKMALPMCLGCHGDENSQVEKAMVEIRKIYPDDKATGYKLGDLRGAFVTEAELSQ